MSNGERAGIQIIFVETVTGNYTMSDIVNIEDAESMIVGHTYLVNCAYVNTVTENVWHAHSAKFIPLLGPKHEDREILKFPDEHWHVNWPFVENDVYFASLGEARARIQSMLKAKDGKLRPVLDGPERWLLAFAVVPGKNATNQRLVRRPLRCLRPAAEFSAEVEWLANLERAYLNKRVCSNICPHRGISLVGAPEDPLIPGSVVCPGHGLCFDRQTGALRQRAHRLFT